MNEMLPTNHPESLATDLWALLDTGHSPAGILNHELAIPIIKEWIEDNAHIISGWYVQARSRAISELLEGIELDGC